MKRMLILFTLLVSVAVTGRPANAQVKQAEKALKKQSYDEALRYVDEALRANPDDAKAFELRGRIYHGKASAAEDSVGHLQLLRRMMESFERAVTLDPQMATAIQNMLDFTYATEFQRGIETFTEAQSANDLNRYLQSSRHFEASSIVAPDSIEPYVNWAFSLVAAGYEADAIKPFEMVVERGEQDEEVFSYLSRLYLTNDRAADAVPLLEQATKAFPANEELQNNLLTAYTLSGQTDRAIDVYGQIVANAPDDKVHRYNYGSLLLQAGRYDAAIEQLKVAVSLDAEYADAQYNLGVAYLNQALTANRRVNEVSEELVVNRDLLSEEEIQAKESELEGLKEERLELFGLAIAPLERAKNLLEAAGENVTDVCKVLFQSYAQTGQADKAESVQACAGM